MSVVQQIVVFAALLFLSAATPAVGQTCYKIEMRNIDIGHTDTSNDWTVLVKTLADGSAGSATGDTIISGNAADGFHLGLVDDPEHPDNQGTAEICGVTTIEPGHLDGSPTQKNILIKDNNNKILISVGISAHFHQDITSYTAETWWGSKVMTCLDGRSFCGTVLTSDDGTVRYTKIVPSQGDIYGISWASLSRADCNILAVDIGQIAAAERDLTGLISIPVGCCSSNGVIYWGKLSMSSAGIANRLLTDSIFVSSDYTALAQPPPAAADPTVSEMLVFIQDQQGCTSP